MKKNVLIIGAGGVARVSAHKCAQYTATLGNIAIASRTIEKCDEIINSIRRRHDIKQPDKIRSFSLNAENVEDIKDLIHETNSQIVINVCSDFLNKPIFDACAETGTAYIDTSMYETPDQDVLEPPWYEHYEWSWREKCDKNNCTAILSAGFDPGVVNAYAAYTAQYCFDSIESIDILDVNHGTHGEYFATNFNAEINFREFEDDVLSWQDRKWVTNEPFSVKETYDFPVIGTNDIYLTNHEEVHSLSQILNVDSIRFWMGFTEHYLNVYNVLENLGLLESELVKTSEGIEISPLKLIKAVLPDPASLAPKYKGKTCIGNKTVGMKDGKKKEIFIYNVHDHEDSYKEVGSQAISYTAGVPPVAAALLIAEDQWDVKKLVNIEELPSKPFIKKLAELGLKTYIRDSDGTSEIKY
jgi:saccharopine dehydrogenase-like NADP-dependent oxidoreductase